MPSVELVDVQIHLPQLVDRIANGREKENIIMRDGHPAARLVTIARCDAGPRIGLLKGKPTAPSLERLDAHDAAIAHTFTGKR